MEEISVLDGNFHNLLTFLDKPLAVGNEVYGNYYLPLTCFEKIFTGLINSLFIWLPTSTATFICFRRFIMQGVEAGYSAALGTMAASLFWLTSIIFGLRFIVVPWMSLDLFRYWLGFLLLMKYFWDNRYAYKEVKHNSVFGKQTRRNIFAFHFLLALTEQTSLYPFLSNLSISSQSTLLEGFPSENIFDFTVIHFSYLLGIAIGSYSLINLLSWFWQDPAYRFYFWIMNKFKKLRVADIVRPVHLFFQSITVLFAFSSLPYFGIEYQVTNPLGFVPNDQVFHQFKQTSFLTHSTSPAYYRSRLNFPRQKFFRYEDWAEYYHRNTPIDTSLYDQGAYRLYTMEDLSYGKDYEWMRRRSDKIKIRSRLKRLRWFPRNWANRLWEFTKTWSRRNVLWRNDILNMYQYSWDSKAPIIWNKLVFEEFFPTSFGKSNTNTSNNSDLNTEKSKLLGNLQSNKENLLTTKKAISKNWDSFWGPDPDWTTKFLSNQQSLTNTDSQFRLNYLSRFNVSDNDVWWKWLSSPDEVKNRELRMKTQKQDFWQPQNRLLSIYSENTNVQKQELNLEFSTLRKFVRKLTARFKLATLNQGFQSSETTGVLTNRNDFLTPSFVIKTNTLSENSLKSLLITPSLKDWAVFQTLLANINSVLWWQRFSPGVTMSNKSNKFGFSNEGNLRDPRFKEVFFFSEEGRSDKVASTFSHKKTHTKSFLSDSLYSNSKDLSNQEPVLFDQNSFKTFRSFQGLIYSDNKTKFEKLQDKYREVRNRQNSLLNEMNSSKSPTFFKASEQRSDIRATNFSRHFSQEKQGQLLKQKLFSIDSLNRNSTSNGKNDNNGVFLSNFSHSNQKMDPLFASEIGTISDKKTSSTLLHPVKYYLHKEQNFKRKLRFYGVKNTRSFAVNNISYTKTNIENERSDSLPSFSSLRAPVAYANRDDKNELGKLRNKNKLPIFNFYLKTYFQTYKKTKLYVLNTKMKRQLGMGASARRKGRDYSNKLLKRAKILSNTPWIRQWIDQSGFLARRKRLETWIARQHYDPNELWAKIMKTDVDLFMKRQPSSYFLTNTEENLLHLRRFLLFEYYDSLRWYTYMTNYRSMKNSIGGTKSFTNKLYNQQFKGTFHKVRHLFSLTPSASNGSLLKFDRPLYNFESSNKNSFVPSVPTNLTEKPNSSRGPLYHEELTDLPPNEATLPLNPKYLMRNQKSDPFFNKVPFFFASLKKGPKSSNTMFEPMVLIEKTGQNEIIKNNLQKRLMIKILHIRKKQKWTVDYKRASEKLWKKWKLRSNIQEPKSIVISEPDSRITEGAVRQITEKNNFEQPRFRAGEPTTSVDYGGSGLSSLTRKLVQIKKLELFKVPFNFSQRKNIGGNIYRNNSSLISSDIVNSAGNNFNKSVTLQKIFNQNIFTRKLINERYKKLVNKRERASSLFAGSFNFNLRKIIDNRILKPSTIRLRDLEKARVNNSQLSPLSSDLATKTNIQLYEINKIRQERSNIQNFVFMKKFLVNENFTMLTRSQLRPLPGKRTKALYDKLPSSKSNVQGLFIVSSTNVDSSFFQNSGDLGLLSRLNSKWKVFVDNLRTSPELVSNKLDKTLQIKLINNQKENLLTTALKTPSFDKTEVQKDFLAVTNSSLRDSSAFKNIAIQKLTKTLLSKKNLNSAPVAALRDVEKPITSRITKSARKRQQDSVTRSLLKRHLNLKSRRKLFLKTKEINNQRLVLDRKYEIQERIFLNKIGFLSDVKKGLEMPISSDINSSAESKFNLPETGFLQTGKTFEERTNNLKLNRWLTGSVKLPRFENMESFANSRARERSKNALNNNPAESLRLLGSLKYTYLREKTKQKDMNPLLPQEGQSNKVHFSNQSYLSSTKRSTLFIDKILKQHKVGREVSPDYLNYRLKQNFVTSSFGVKKSEQFLKTPFSELGAFSKLQFSEVGGTLENEKSSLRRTLRKFSTQTSLQRSSNAKVQKISQNTKRNKTNFINNLLVKTWLTKLGKFEENSDRETTSRASSNIAENEKSSVFFSESKKNVLPALALSSVGLDKGVRFREPELINLNKYIMFARTNQNKLSRQQIRKKLKKRRIIRMKRTERLKTLKDHPLKFRSEQIQTFYNIRDSLKKWKNSAFILEKTKYTNLFFSTPNKMFELEKTGAYGNQFSEPQKGWISPSLGSNPSKLAETGPILTALYKDIFINSSSLGSTTYNQDTLVKAKTSKTEDGSYGGEKITNETLMVTDPKPLLINTTNMPFYAGWDESLRKFVLTNRLLNRREAGYQSSNIFGQNNIGSALNTINSDLQTSNLEKNIIFSLWPLKGTNPATTLFSQFPFMTAPQTNLNYSPQQIRSIKAGSKYDLQTSITLNKLSNQDENSFDKKWKQKYTTKEDTFQSRNKGNKSDQFTKNNSTSYLNFKKMNRIKTFIKSSKNDEQIGIRQSGQVISNLANPTTRKLARNALFSGRSGSTNRKKLLIFGKKRTAPLFNQNPKLFISGTFNKSIFSEIQSESIDKKLSTKTLLLRNLRQGNRAQTQLVYIRRLQKTLRPTGSSWKTNQVLSRRKKQRIKQNNFWGQKKNDQNRFSVRKRKKRGNNKNPRLRGDKNYKKTKRQYRQKLYLRPKNKPLRRRSLGVNFKNKLNYWRRNYQYLSLNDSNLTKELKSKNEVPFNFSQKNIVFQTGSENIADQNTSVGINSSIFSENLKSNSRYSQREKEWNFLNKLDNRREGELSLSQTSSLTRRPRQLYRSLFRNPNVQTPILYTTLPGHSRSIPLIKNLPLPSSSVKTLNRVIKWSSADGASRFYRVNLSYGWAMTLFLNNLQQKVNSENSSSVNNLIKAYLTELEKTNQTKFSSSREFKRKFYKLRQLSYTMSLRLYDRWFFYYYKTTNSKPQTGQEQQSPDFFHVNSSLYGTGNLVFNQKIETNINNKLKQSILNSSAVDPVEQTLSPFKHIKKFLTFQLASTESKRDKKKNEGFDESSPGSLLSKSRREGEKALENQSNFRSYLKNLRTTATSGRRNLNEEVRSDKVASNFSPKTQNTGIENTQALQSSDTFNETNQSNGIKPSSGRGNESTLSLENQKAQEFGGLDNFKLFSSENSETQKNSTVTNFTQSNFFSSDKKENQDSVKSNKTLLKKEKKYAEDRFFFAQFNKPPLVDDYRLTLENNRHYPLNGGFVWPGDYLRLQTILLPKEMKDLYLLKKANAPGKEAALLFKRNKLPSSLSSFVTVDN